MGPSSSEGSEVAPLVLSLAIPNNLVLTMSSIIGTILATTRTIQNLETLQYYVLCTPFPLLGHLDDQCSEFLESWMAYWLILNLKNFPTLSNTALLLAMVHCFLTLVDWSV